MAVLARITSMAERVRAAFERANIPVVSVGMGSLFDTPEGEAALNYSTLWQGKPKRLT